jgi:branched-chain amino acid transport system ATP-binding protein
MAALLEIRGLVKRFGGLIAVNGLDLGIEAGEVRGLIGPNGSGKTTTINLVSALYRPDRGEILLGGERIERLRPHEIAARGVARTFQISKLFANMTVLENVLVPALAELDRRGARRARRSMSARGGCSTSSCSMGTAMPSPGSSRAGRGCSCRSRAG